jgi:hypothetical protein
LYLCGLIATDNDVIEKTAANLLGRRALDTTSNTDDR